jgi:NTE family protein
MTRVGRNPRAAHTALNVAIRLAVVAAACLGIASVARAEALRIEIVPSACPAARPPAIEAAALPPVPGLGIALGSGSMHGIAHIGVLEELEARGLPVRVVTGTSVGALVGALWASGLSATEIARMNRLQDWEDVGYFTLRSGGLFSNDDLRARLARVLGARPIETWPRRFGAVAVDIATGERVTLTKGDGALAVQASTAVPAYFVPVEVAGKRLGDGALVEPVPVDLARELGATFVIAVDVAYRPHEERAESATQIAFQALHIVTNTLANEQMKRADVALSIDLHRTFTRCGRVSLVAAGREALRQAWPQIEERLRRAAPR